MYRFHPSVQWKSGYPTRQQIIDQITQLWKRYGLDERTEFNTKVEHIYKDKTGRWIINNPANGHFDGVIAAVGTCGAPKMPPLPGQEKFKGTVVHSSELTADHIDAKGKRILVIGGGASAVEAVEFAIKTGAASTSILSRSDKWIIPRNAIVDILLAFNIFGQETLLSWIPEGLLRRFFYRDLRDLAPTSSKGLFTDTPMVNSELFHQIRTGKARWLRGDILEATESGILFNHRERGVPKNGPGVEKLIEGDIIIMATGFKRPSLAFLPDEVFQPPYAPPNWYLQTFATELPSLCAINSTYVNAIGTVGNWHVGIYTRLLLMFLVDPLARPHEYWMKRWVDMTRYVKRFAPTGAFDFFTYSELLYWFVFSVAINPFRWKWAAFVFFGLGKDLPLRIVEREEAVRRRLGVKGGSGYDGFRTVKS
jgi:Flavin-binding monooxygenase-like